MPSIGTISTILVIIIGLTTLAERLTRWYKSPHKTQDEAIKKINEKQQEHGEQIINLTSEMCDVKGSLQKIETNHLAHLQADVSGLKESNAEMRTDIKWIVGKLNG